MEQQPSAIWANCYASFMRNKFHQEAETGTTTIKKKKKHPQTNGVSVEKKTEASLSFFFNPHQSICLLILETEEGRGRERNIDWLRLLSAMTGDQTLDPGMYHDRE